MTGIKVRDTRASFQFITSMMPTYSATRNRVRSTSISWLHTKVRITSTSEVHRWMMSPVAWAVCHWKLRRWMWLYRLSRSFFTKPSEPFAMLMRIPKMHTPRKAAVSTTAPAAIHRAVQGSARSRSRGNRVARKPGRSGSLAPSTESTVTLMICGITALQMVFIYARRMAPAKKAQFP